MFCMIVLFKKASDQTTIYEITDEYSKIKTKLGLSFNDINLISSSSNNPVHKNNFKNSKVVDYRGDIKLSDYGNYLLKFCDGYNTEIIYTDNKIYPICNVFDNKVEEEYHKKDGINLIWKNLMKSEDFERIMSQITVWFKDSENFYKGIEMISMKLKNLCDWNEENARELYVTISNLEFKNEKLVLQINNPSQRQILLVNNFFKDIFYFYLINYKISPIENDYITNRSFIEVFQSFLSFKEYE